MERKRGEQREGKGEEMDEEKEAAINVDAILAPFSDLIFDLF